MTTATTEIQVCVDCLTVTANGELLDGGPGSVAEHVRRMTALWGDDVEIVPGSDDEGSFSWSSCDGCGSTLGGDRYTAYAIERVREGA